ncbi:MAG: 1,4-alpha-glucan branching protein GlgB [Kiritimatiellae bacterium]|nr:1,4-alpha-glucan branching protein GlgB [Kiritimatiellia bacterium]
MPSYAMKSIALTNTIIIRFDMNSYLEEAEKHCRAYKRMGAHCLTIKGVQGVRFSVWAPNAASVYVVGDFNHWESQHHSMERQGNSGIWDFFIPGLKPGDLYKFEIKGLNGSAFQKADPYAFASEMRPQTASMIWDFEKYLWNDLSWMETRRETNWLENPISIYEVHLGSWRRKPEANNDWLTYRELAKELIPYIKEMGFTHIELLPLTEYPLDESWGYQTIGYFSPTSRFGNPDDLKLFIDQCHQNYIGVILDWVPAHFPKDDHGLARFDGTYLYEHADPRKGEHVDWGTLIFNYGRDEARNFLLSNAMYWADIYHIDGIRVDAVASMLYLDYSREENKWLPNPLGGRENLEAIDFLKKFNESIHREYPGFLTFAEESTAWPMVSRPTSLGGLGFDFKWNMGWMHDTLQYFSKEPIHRKYHHNDITFSLMYAFTENFTLPFSHDEVVHGKGSLLRKMPGDLWQQHAHLRLLYAYMYAHPGKKLLFMGDEFGQLDEWNCYEDLDWHLLQWEAHEKLSYFTKDLNRIYTQTPCLYEIDFSPKGFEWIDLHNAEQSIISFFRKRHDPKDRIVCIFNFTSTPRENYRVGVPLHGSYAEVLNSDSELYGGSNIGNQGNVDSVPLRWQNYDYSLCLTLPPLGALYLRLELNG